MATDPNLLMNLVNAPTLAGQSVFAGVNNALAQAMARQNLQKGQFELGLAQQQQQQQQMYQTDVASFTADPTPQNLMGLIAKYPKQYEALQSGWKLKDQAQRTSDLSFFSDVHGALSKGNTKLAIGALEARLAAEKKAGIDTTQEEQWLEQLRSGDPEAIGAVKALALGQIGAAVGPDKFADAYKTVGGEGGAFTLGPGSRRFDSEGKLLAEAPFAPRPVTVGEGETVVEYQPGGGDPSSSGGGNPLPRMLEITPFSESGNQEYTANGQRVTSPKGARGIMQVMPHTAADPGYGLKKSDGSPADDARLGRQYLGKMLEIYKNPAQAWAAYNAGPGAVDKAIQSGGPNWLSKLPKETREYVAKNMAALGAQSGGQSGPRVIAQGAPKPEKPQYQQVSPQEAASLGLDPNVRYQRSPDGQVTAIGGQSKAQLKPWPIPALQARSSNEAALKNIFNALWLLDEKNSKDPRAAAARKAIGPTTGMLGNYVTNTRDPKGAEFRALIGQIGGLIIKDTSGAAVSLSEDARLAKWVPLVTDSPNVAVAKLRNLERELKQRNMSMEEVYTEDQGYRPFSQGAAQGGAPSGGGRDALKRKYGLK